MGSYTSGFPTLQPAYILKVIVGEGNPVGDIHSGSSFVHYSTPAGSITTIHGFEPQVEADVVFGGDWLYFDHDKQRARVNVKAVAKTIDGAQSIGFQYTGVVKLSDEIKQIFAGHPDSHTIPFGQSTTIHTFEAGTSKYSDLENNSWVGNGRFIVEDGKLIVESRVSRVVPSTDMD